MAHYDNLVFKTSSIAPLKEGIKLMNSPNPTKLPQRSNFEYTDQYRVVRETNRNLYASIKDNYVDDYLFESEKDTKGLYFFFKMSSNIPKFFYIGISGTRDGQAAFLKERLRKHLITFDYFIYALAFPENNNEYLDDCIKFYAEGKYANKKETFKRQFKAFKQIPFESIAWIGSDAFTPELLNILENHFIYEYKPPANGNKINKLPPPIHTSEYSEINDFLLKRLTQSI